MNTSLATVLQVAERVEVASAFAYRKLAEGFTARVHRDVLIDLEQEELAHAARIREAASVCWRLSITESAASSYLGGAAVAALVRVLEDVLEEASRSTRDWPRLPHLGWSTLVVSVLRNTGGPAALAEMFDELSLEHALQHRYVEALREAREAVAPGTEDPPPRRKRPRR